LKDYGYYPKSWPLFSYMDHGLTLFDKIPDHELTTDAPVIFKFSPRLVEIFKTKSNKPVFCVLNPYVHYRKKHNITQSPDATGTLFFPAHSTEAIDDKTNWLQFIQQFQQIPATFHPINICLHPTDVNKGLDQIFIQNGYKVYSAGSAYDTNFTANLYKILTRHKYTMSNIPGSYSFYSVDLGIPFSLFGEQPKYFNNGDKNIEPGEYNSFLAQPPYQKALKLFNGFSTDITDEQKTFVSFELGKSSSISRLKTSVLLYKALVTYLVKHPLYRRELARHIINSQQSFPFRKFRQLIRAFKYLKFNLATRFLRKEGDDYKISANGLAALKEVFRLKTGNAQNSSLFGKPVAITDSFWYLHSLKEIFVDDIYKFKCEHESPYIVDCGANIGLSVIYFKRLFPKAEIVAFEPDVTIFQMLKANLRQFDCTNVDTRNEAVWKEATTLKFSANGGLGGQLVDESGQTVTTNITETQTARLKDYLKRPVDFLKMDIEGAEVVVLQDCAEELKNVNNLFVEYHSEPNSNQELHTLLMLLQNAGFKYYVKEAWNNLPLPYLRTQYNPHYDLQLNIFAYRF
jgi:FkbM family methyltransferase